MRQKGFANAFLLIAVLVLTALVGAYYMGQKSNKQINPPSSSSPATAETANWKTFTSAKYNFTLKYPGDSDWFMQEMPTPVSPHTISIAGQCTKCSPSTTVDALSINPSTYQSADEYLKARFVAGPNNTAITDYRKVTINGVEAIKAADAGICEPGADGCENSTIEYFIVNGNKSFVISEYYKNQTHLTKLNQFPSPSPDIVSTLKFLN